MQGLAANYYELTAMIIFGIGFTSLLLNRNIIKKIIGFNLMDTGIFLYLGAKGYIEGRLAPIIVEGNTDFETYINPIPSGLVLTGIVVSVSVSAFFCALAVRLYKAYGTLDLEDIINKMHEDQGVY